MYQIWLKSVHPLVASQRLSLYAHLKATRLYLKKGLAVLVEMWVYPSFSSAGNCPCASAKAAIAKSRHHKWPSRCQTKGKINQKGFLGGAQLCPVKMPKLVIGECAHPERVQNIGLMTPLTCENDVKIS